MQQHGSARTRVGRVQPAPRRLRDWSQTPGAAFSGIHALRDVGIADLEKYKDALPETIYRRCRHVVTENQRVLDAAKTLQSGDAGGVGRLMYASHASLRDDYEVSCKELDLLVELAASSPGVYGARMTGGGFGGCTVNLVREGSTPRRSACTWHGPTRKQRGLRPIFMFVSWRKARRPGQLRRTFDTRFLTPDANARVRRRGSIAMCNCHCVAE